MSDGGWSVEWYTPHDTVLVEFWGVLTDEIVRAALDKALQLAEIAEGDLNIYCIVDESRVLDLNPNSIVAAALHDVFFHPRSGKMYLVANEQQIVWINDIFNSRRPDSVRLVGSVDEAAMEIAKRRALYRARQETKNQEALWEVSWLRPDDVLLMEFKGYFSAEVLNRALDKLGELLDGAQGDLLIYIISDESGITHFENDLHVQALLHPVYFHPRGGKLYIVGSTGELFAMNETFAELRQGAVRLMDTRAEAIADIDKRRAAYLARKKES